MTIKSVAYRLRKFVEGAAYSAAFIFISNNSYLLYVTYPGFRRDFFIWALSFIKIPSSHVGNFRKAVVFIVESGI